jgi:hypothetical protein
MYYGFGTNVVKGFTSYLTGRSARVHVGQWATDYRGPDIGVPQGSVLGPLIYNI